ncbi:S8 family serine peptidase [Jiulongibacter sediminis]|uniref:Peptidase S8/S53 domain-containing protein n=1 Tax=Jiulongibacter sediminis TaxID=1605367 RepID=A0A0N8H9A5_9BACT|nr:S8 family serine peptidase [Jiulongibacter sediminis]KPM46828.1 hypothetical protein AFM12_16410 [Jiulongibacter sediminis]TBX22179.1 hypothetical protein TK44_16420 [Jiulongibacter sediminis]
MKKRINLFLIFLIGSFGSLAQSSQERLSISSSMDSTILNQIKSQFQLNYDKREREIGQYLIKNPEQKRSFVKDGSVYYLQRIDANGTPIYINTKNKASGELIKANQLYTGGSLGVNIAGQSMIAGVWDGGQVRASHELLSGKVGMQAGQTYDGSASNYAGNNHQTHVTGTIVGKDIVNQPSARGIAFEASAQNYDWDNDLAEMATFASGGYLISNHSYGYSNDNTLPEWLFGAYDYQAQQWDLLLKNAPNYLPFIAVGNEQQFNGNSAKAGYDLITGTCAAKNVMTVGAVNGDKTMSDYSNWGPTDDGRLKPEIVTKGTGINSSYFADQNTNQPSDVAYSGNGANSSGTSYASPAAAGAGLLLQQYYNSLHGSYMKAATLKALMLTTAEDLGQPGPDNKFGWGLLDVEKAADAIKSKSSAGNPTAQQVSDTDSKGSFIEEITYNIANNGLAEREVSVTADGSVPLIVGIAWTDDEGTEQTSAEGVDPTTSRLVHEFDLLVRNVNSSNDTRPWKPSVMSNRTANATLQTGWFDGNNNNYKQVKIDNPVAGAEYKIFIRKKASSPAALKAISLVVTGTSQTACPQTLTLTNPTHNVSTGIQVFQAVQTVVASNVISGSADVVMRAGNSIELKPSTSGGGNTFESGSGTKFLATIGGCAN